MRRGLMLWRTIRARCGPLLFFQLEVCESLEALPRHVHDNPMGFRRAEAAFEGFWVCYNKLSAPAISTGSPCWHTVPKLHYEMHLLDDMRSDGLNPIYYQGYADEDYMQWIIKIAWGAAHGCLEDLTLQRWLFQQRGVWSELAASRSDINSKYIALRVACQGGFPRCDLLCDVGGRARELWFVSLGSESLLRTSSSFMFSTERQSLIV